MTQKAPKKMYHISQRALRTGTTLTVGAYGERIRRNNFIEQHYDIHVKEELFEMIRSEYYPEAPSRFNAVFLFPEFNIAKEFYANSFNYQHYVYEVEVTDSKPFIAEMDLLKCEGMSFLTLCTNAHKYWQQVKHPNSGSLEAIVTDKVIVKQAILEPSYIWEQPVNSFLSSKRH